jgi:hypothetical protein
VRDAVVDAVLQNELGLPELYKQHIIWYMVDMINWVQISNL